MPTASDELRDKMGVLFQGEKIDCVGPLKFLLDRGFKEARGIIYPPNQDHQPTGDEWDCLMFLFHEWDFGYDGRKGK